MIGEYVGGGGRQEIVPCVLYFVWLRTPSVLVPKALPQLGPWGCCRKISSAQTRVEYIICCYAIKAILKSITEQITLEVTHTCVMNCSKFHEYYNDAKNGGREFVD